MLLLTFLVNLVRGWGLDDIYVLGMGATNKGQDYFAGGDPNTPHWMMHVSGRGGGVI